jgi:hypothetical protein
MKWRTVWEEFKLRLRVLRNALGSALGYTGEITPVGRLYAKLFRADGSVVNLGLVSTKVVTDAGVAYLVDALQNLTEPENFKYHGSGTGTTAEAASQTALVTEVGTRATGSQAEGASANIYKTVGTVTYTSTYAITEHGIFSASSTGTMLDRSVFAAINVVNGDAIEFTYELTLPSGS